MSDTQAAHGRDCPKAAHLGEGYLHAADDDGPYDVDGVAYCGRCHGWLGASVRDTQAAALITPEALQAAQELIDIVLQQCGGFLSGPGFDAAQKARALKAALAAPAEGPQAVAPEWRDHVEQRIRTWRQRTMNKSGDMLAIDDFMGQESIDDLVDFVCDEWAAPTAPDKAEPDLAAELQECRQDAERYRWLRERAPGEIVFDHTERQMNGGSHFVLRVPFDGEPVHNDAHSALKLDAAIDALRRKGGAA